ncbi:MAG: valine--tRNA ligase [Chloroflexi bacterium]|nr:MAG: valine--tRNA ligase [Phototrophicales bacterium]RMF81782.1 MAG: valine--tRNA ligase [Chloroflexota bacterium]
MGRQLAKNFDFAEAEARIYKWWEQNGWFKPEIAEDDAEPFVISIPPPNVTGALHIGHALFATLEDLMIRYERMRGKAALWVPGTDHAGIATQLQVEKVLREEGTSRHEIGREEFLRRTWQWKERYGGRIQQQLRRMGASCDWDRERFTLDEGLSKAVQEVFIKLYEQGLIYRGPRLVNWSPGLQTAVSDLEVERFDESAKLYFFKYPIEGGGYIPVATTRPETILADTAVAVHPEDERYQAFIGKNALVPMLNRPIPVIADEYVDREFGTGALKVTPGHDFNDYEIGMRHNLPIISAMNRDATMNEQAGSYAGLDRFACREKLWTDMEAAGLAIRVEDHIHNVPRSQRGGELIEPMLSTQWFVKMQPLAEKAIAAVRNGDIKIVPEHFEKTYFHWLENIQDWCVSRQLWWGHRIPAWYGPDGEIHVGREAPDDGREWIPEEDVLDTWFSSGLWPFSTLGWPEETDDFRRFYPTSVMETGYDILFFWVARMIMLGLWFTGKPPFHTVYLHGLVRDKHGRKISKTLGNTLDPIELVDKYGADPLRFTLVTSGTPGNDINLDPARVEANWRFVNKMWQMTSFTLQNLDDDFEMGLPDVDALDLPSQWILSRLNRLIATVDRLFGNYQYGEAGRQIYEFLWHEFADWYIEISKYPLYGDDPVARRKAQQVLVHTLDTAFRLLHPFMPFVTEELWQHIPHQGEALIIAQWPEVDETYLDDSAENVMNMLIDLVRGVRNVRKDYNVDPGRRITALAEAGRQREIIEQFSYVFSRLCNIENVDFLDDGVEAPEDAASVVSGEVILYLPLAGMVDIEAERQRLTAERENLEQMIAKSQKMLANENFVTRAKPEVVERERNRLVDFEAQLGQVTERLEKLTSSS